jgi:hypothetical protein
MYILFLEKYNFSSGRRRFPNHVRRKPYAAIECSVDLFSTWLVVQRGDFRNIFMPSEMIGKGVDKIIFAEKGLTLNLIPDGLLADPDFTN